MSDTTYQRKEREFLGGALKLSIQPYHLKLRTAFGTSHSSSTTRTNALIGVEFKQFVGWGEVGLPPKKKHCYLADYNDIDSFFDLYCQNVTSELNGLSETAMKTYRELFTNADQVFSFPLSVHNYFQAFSVENPDQLVSVAEVLPMLLLKVLDCYKYLDEQNNPLEHRLAAQCGIEMAVLDLLGSMNSKTLYLTVGINAPLDKSSFYTVALNSDENEWLRSVDFGLQYTSHLKIKLDQDIEKGVNILEKLLSIYSKTNLPVSTWSVDANSAWDPELTISFLEKLQERVPQILPFMYMVEQPFPVDFLEIVESDADVEQKWRNVKQYYSTHNVLLFGDESVSTSKQIPRIKHYVHGVNIKLEKAGGIRGALDAITVAKQNDLKVWLGCMVSSRLSCTSSAHILSLSEIGGDLDGDLLVEESSQLFNGGFTWANHSNNLGTVVLPHDQPGIGLKKK